uniref:Uncharacterized protein n=1 Tax=Arundo donax TaxID=35708 RepID=A0A0A9AZK5_ARUDO
MSLAWRLSLHKWCQKSCCRKQSSMKAQDEETRAKLK